MMTQTVPTATLVGVIFTLIISIGLPIALLLTGKLKLQAKWRSALKGALTFIVFALVLESLFNQFVVASTGTLITGNTWLLAIYGGLAAATFEEVGRYLIMKYWMKKDMDAQNAFMFGSGHGGIESILLVGMTSITNLVLIIMINSGQIESILATMDEVTAQAVLTSVSAYFTTPSYMFVLAGVERIAAIFLHLCCTYFVYRAIRYQHKLSFLYAFAAHFLVDFVTVLLQAYVPIIIVEGILVAIVACFVLFTFKQFVKDCDAKEA